ncbi:MAG TPA: hypothetical protein VGX23_22465 [Actinocrinis sp.]|nr:hypothetical protein [Actinocrinis sp.]
MSRRNVLAGGVAAVAGAVAVGAETGLNPFSSRSARTTSATVVPRAQPKPANAVVKGRLIGDGSTSDTGPQPNQPTPQRLVPGEQPPQFVVFSWDGAGEDDNHLFSHFRTVAQETKATMTFFLSGIYTLPRDQRTRYLPPGKAPGESAIGYLDDDHVKATIQQTGAAWLEGHEVGTHFNGHFCDSRGVGIWTPDQWRSEIEQAVGFVHNWKTNTGFTDVDALPFDYGKELAGGRTPCLLGQDQLLPTALDLGWKYDASSPGGLQIWPTKRGGLWDFPLQSMPFPGHKFEVLSMDYNIMFNQCGDNVDADPTKRAFWAQQAAGSYMAAFQRAYTTNRAPFFIGNHFETWNGGIYITAVEQALRQIATHSDVRLVSFRQLVDWMEVQDPTVLAKLRTLDPGKAPTDWYDYTTPATNIQQQPSRQEMSPSQAL